MSKKLSETSLPPMDTLREGLAKCCKILGLDQQTCLALTLMLSSKRSVMTMLWAMEQIEKEDLQLDKDSMTTLIVNIAKEIKKKEL